MRNTIGTWNVNKPPNDHLLKGSHLLSYNSNKRIRLILSRATKGKKQSPTERKWGRES